MTTQNNKLIEQEMQEMMERMHQSDSVVCTNVQNLHSTHMYHSDQKYMAGLTMPIANQIRNVATEHTLWTQTFTDRFATCTQGIIKRGGNGEMSPVKPLVGTNSYNTHPLILKEKNCYLDVHLPFDNMTRRV
jgi:hypothetical protein